MCDVFFKSAVTLKKDKQITVDDGQLHILLQTAFDQLNAQRFHNFEKSCVCAFEPFPSQRHF